MKLFGSTSSPFVRKARVLAKETGQGEEVQFEPVTLLPTSPDELVNSANPLGKIPVLMTNDDQAIYDSRVICEYLDARNRGSKMIPMLEADRWKALTLQSLGDGIMDAGVSMRLEVALRPEKYRWDDWYAAQDLKVQRSLDRLEGRASTLPDQPDIGTISVACALGYLDFRFGDWRDQRPKLAAWFEQFDRRASMQETQFS